MTNKKTSVTALQVLGDDPRRISEVTGVKLDTVRTSLARTNAPGTLDGGIDVDINSDLESIRSKFSNLYKLSDDESNSKIIRMKTEVMKVHIQFLNVLSRLIPQPEPNWGKETMEVIKEKTIQRVKGKRPI